MSIMRLSADFKLLLNNHLFNYSRPELVILLGLFSLIFLVLFDLIFRRKLKTIGGKENQYDKLSFKALIDFIKGQKEINIYNKKNLFLNQILNNSYLSTIQEVKDSLSV